MFGRRTIAQSLVATAAALVAGAGPSVAVAGAMPQSRQGNTRVGYSPRPQVAVGDVCPMPPTPPQGGWAPWCPSMLNASPIPMGSGVAQVPASSAGVNGSATVTLQSVEGFTLVSITITTDTPMLLITNIQAGRALFLESGQVAADLFQSGGTACKLIEGFNIWPSVGISFTFGNPSNTAASVIVSLMGFPMPCPQGNRPN